MKVNKKTVGLSACGLLALGVFLPIVRLPLVGSMNYFSNGKGDGIFVLGIAVVSLVLILINKYKALFVTGFVSVCMLAYTFFNFQRTMSDMKDAMNTSLAGNPFAGFADLALQSVQLEWGWVVLIAGTVLLVAAAILDTKVPDK